MLSENRIATSGGSNHPCDTQTPFCITGINCQRAAGCMVALVFPSVPQCSSVEPLPPFVTSECSPVFPSARQSGWVLGGPSVPHCSPVESLPPFVTSQCSPVPPAVLWSGWVSGGHGVPHCSPVQSLPVFLTSYHSVPHYCSKLVVCGWTLL